MAKQPTPDTLKAHPSVYTYEEWQKGQLHRLYLNVRGRNPKRFRGDANTKVYYDFLTAELVIERGRGTMSGEFSKHIGVLMEAFNYIER